MSDDIVKRLRLTPVLMYTDQLGQSRIDYEACKKYINNEGVKMMRDAADEIERLRAELVSTTNKLTAERDEARRKICEIESQCICDPPRSPQKYAILFGWDCFKEASNEQ